MLILYLSFASVDVLGAQPPAMFVPNKVFERPGFTERYILYFPGRRILACVLHCLKTAKQNVHFEHEINLANFYRFP